ncbi:MAG: exodeoxyribonuclease III [Gammaproteobacteria bacterium]|nr:exodeoxyribonuclease III [Gammaproteobacteria bacterium]
MLIVTLNLNGIRSAQRKGFFDWLPELNADVICLQELKAQTDQLQSPMFHPEGYHCFYRSAVKKGYSGVAMYTRQKPDQVIETMGLSQADDEGRYIECVFGQLHIVSIYLPSGTSGPERQAFKYECMDFLRQKMQDQLGSGEDYILCADWNIAHTKKDIRNWQSNQKNSGFLPEERAWLDSLYQDDGWIDAYRVVNQEPYQFSWWSNRGRAWTNNVGWRIDYQLVNPALKNRIKTAEIYKEQRFSDHSPVLIHYDYAF